MLRRLNCLVVLVFIGSFQHCKTNQVIPHDTLVDMQRLVVVIDEEMPGYFTLGSDSYGYQYELFKAYAESIGAELNVLSGLKPSESRRRLETGEVNLMTTLSEQIQVPDQPFTVPVYCTSYVLLGGRKTAAEARKNHNFNPVQFLTGHKLLVSSGFKYTKTYDMLLDSLPGTNIYVSSRGSFELIEKLRDGTYDFLICELSEAQLGCAMEREVGEIYRFEEPVTITALVSPLNPDLQSDFNGWLQQFRETPQWAKLNDLYFKNGIARQVLPKHHNGRQPGRISPYDELFQYVCEQEGYDWRLIAAIAFSESRFNPGLVSPRGATGLMQVMPRVARQFGVEDGLMDPEVNLLTAVKIIRQIERSLKFAPGTPQADRTRIMLASYNAGIGHVTDARNLARKYGRNPDSWADVAVYLEAKANPDILEHEEVKCGTFNSRETLAFVNQVVNRYDTYCSRVTR